MRVAGLDLGKATAKLACGKLQAGRLHGETVAVVKHRGRPADVIARWYEEHAV